MRPAVACLADAYRAADDALRAGGSSRPSAACRSPAAFERQAARADGLARALNEHWEGEADAW
jgi:hypothetical protein